MTMTDLLEPVRTIEDRRDALSARLFDSFVAGAELLTGGLGRRLDLYRAVHDHGPMNAAELAEHAGIGLRYAREWLEQQAAAGILDVASDSGQAHTRRFELPAAHAPVLLDADHPSNTIGFAPFLTGLGRTLPDVARAFRSGGGVPFERFGREVRDGIALGNRPMFTTELPRWLDRLPDISEHLRRGGLVLDVGCGTGWSSVVLARTFPAARVDGIDADAGSIAEARTAARNEGVANRVRYVVGNAAHRADLPADGYHLVTVFEALHDMGEPVAALRAARAVLAPGGAVLVADERVAHAFAAPVGEIERLMYAASVLHCLPATVAESADTANGTVLRASTVGRWASEAGFAVTELPIENPLWRFYRLDPVQPGSAG
jgi:ubiquinone/menaquinone biosynthesis C-methylase UbiE